jgi:Flp pilus assembly protein TadG
MGRLGAAFHFRVSFRQFRASTGSPLTTRVVVIKDRLNARLRIPSYLSNGIDHWKRICAWLPISSLVRDFSHRDLDCFHRRRLRTGQAIKPIGGAMAMKFLDFLQRHVPLFGRDRRGNVAIMFALATIPIFGAVGAAIDYSRANSTRTAMQAAVDSTALMLSKDAVGLDAVQLQTKADQYFRAMFNRPEGHDITITPVLSLPVGGQFSLTVSAAGKVDTMFARILGHNETAIDALSQVQWRMKNLELALALDNTGSMSSSGKMMALKAAVHALLETLRKAEKKPGDIKVAIIPFDTTVRVNQDHKSAAPWIMFDDQQEKNTWIGCLEDREQPNDVNDTPPDLALSSTLYPAKHCANNGALVPMLALTSDWNALRLTVNQMNPNGDTNVTIGLVWAWHALTTNAPLNEASAPRSDLEKVIILLTDGQNTHNRWTGNTSQIDARTKKACDNIKAANIKLYTVRVIEGNVDLLRGCATSPDMYYDVQQADQLISVFNSVASKLANVYIAK